MTSRRFFAFLAPIAALALFALTLLVAAPAAAAQPQPQAQARAQTQNLWLHVKVHDPSDENTRVTVNLPISLVQSALPMLEQSGEIHDGRVDIQGTDVTADDLRRVLTSLKSAPDATFAQVQTDTETIVFFKEGNYLRVEGTATADGTEIHAHFPIAVLDALLSGPGNQLDLGAAIQALTAEGAGDLVTVRDGQKQVRVWIDDAPEAE